MQTPCVVRDIGVGMNNDGRRVRCPYGSGLHVPSATLVSARSMVGDRATGRGMASPLRVFHQ